MHGAGALAPATYLPCRNSPRGAEAIECMSDANTRDAWEFWCINTEDNASLALFHWGDSMCVEQMDIQWENV